MAEQQERARQGVETLKRKTKMNNWLKATLMRKQKRMTTMTRMITRKKRKRRKKQE